MQYKFKDNEIGRILRNLVVLVDTREQANDHIIQHFKEHKITYKKQKLDYGDYSCMLPIGTFEGQTRDVYFTNDIVVERKFCIDELAMNLKDKKTNLKEVNQEIIDLLGKEYLAKVLKSDYNRFKQELTSINKSGISFFIAIEDHLFDKHLENHAYRALYEPETLKARLRGLEREFNTVIRPVSKDYIGDLIYTTLKYGVRNILVHKGFNPFTYREDKEKANIDVQEDKEEIEENKEEYGGINF